MTCIGAKMKWIQLKLGSIIFCSVYQPGSNNTQKTEKMNMKKIVSKNIREKCIPVQIWNQRSHNITIC
jgi:hypothetical protein